MRTSVYPVCRVLLVTILLFQSCTSSKPAGNPEPETGAWFKQQTWLNGLQLTPHASIDQEEFRRQYEANRAGWDMAFAFLKEADLAALKPGKHPIDGDNVFVLVTEGPGKDPATTPWEGHQLYNDIHYVVAGKEKIGLSPISAATLTTPYDGTKDIAFYTAKGTFHEADTKTFFIIFPQQAHCPGIKVEGHEPVKKIVIKVKR